MNTRKPTPEQITELSSSLDALALAVRGSAVEFVRFRATWDKIKRLAKASNE